MVHGAHVPQCRDHGDELDREGPPRGGSGRQHRRQWDADAGPRTDLVIDAVSVGHDLTKGVATFTRATADASLVDENPSGDTASDGADEASEPVEAESEAEVGADALVEEVSAAA